MYNKNKRVLSLRYTNKGMKKMSSMQNYRQDIQDIHVSVVLPTLNEAQNLRYVLPFIPPIVSEVILVDGNSTDDTVTVAKQILPEVRIVKQTKKGKGNALQAGFAASTGDIIVMLDADGSTDPTEIPRFVQPLLEGYDCAKGSRFMKSGSSHDITIIRRLGNHLLCQLVNTLFHTRSSDLCYGYNAFWKHCLNHVDITCDGFEVETQIYLRMHKAQLKIAEVPSIENQRIYGKSNLHTFRDGWRVLRTIIKEWVRDQSSLPQPQYDILTLHVKEEAFTREKIPV
jgi:glycosyltransferase involved in cell wall biosynthesis